MNKGLYYLSFAAVAVLSSACTSQLHAAGMVVCKGMTANLEIEDQIAGEKVKTLLPPDENGVENVAVSSNTWSGLKGITQKKQALCYATDDQTAEPAVSASLDGNFDTCTFAGGEFTCN